MNIIEIYIDKIIYGGDGMGLVEGKVHFVPGVLPGELVSAEVVEEKRGFNRCRLLKILEPSPYRVEPTCSLYGRCGGCNFQHTDYENQLQIKQDIIRDVFKRNGKIELKDVEIVRSKAFNYRNRIQVHHKSGIKGFRETSSSEIVEVDTCPVVVDNLNSYLSEAEYLDEGRELVFSNGERYFISGRDSEATVEILGKVIHFSPSSFFQSNLSMIPKLIDLVNSNIQGHSVMDLYCGSGLFSSFLPDSVTRVTAVELDSRVKEYYTKNVGNRVFDFYPLSLEKYIKRGLHKKNLIDTVIVDPPRKGLSQAVIKFLLSSGIKRVIYVSCDPVTMARDIKLLIEEKYRLNIFRALDFYPQTHHIESFGVLDLV